MSPPIPTLTKLSTPPPWLSGPVPTPATCLDLSRAVWLVIRSDLKTHPTTFSTHPQKVEDKVSERNSPSSVPSPSFNHTLPTHFLPPLPTMHPSAFCQRIPVVVASVVEAEYAAAFGGEQVLAELSLTLTNLGHPQQPPPLLFVDNECAIGLATSSVRPKKSKSIDMHLDWLKERVSQFSPPCIYPRPHQPVRLLYQNPPYIPSHCHPPLPSRHPLLSSIPTHYHPFPPHQNTITSHPTQSSGGSARQGPTFPSITLFSLHPRTSFHNLFSFLV
jgi:hypothetical protein